MPVGDIEAAITENVSEKRDIFYFVSHPNMTESEHPCLTTKNSLDPGKPCIFPFKSSGGLRYSCDGLYFDLGWCGTKPPSHASGPKDWGYCSENCKSENLISNGTGDLANKDIFWESRFYDLRSWEEGYCYTYNPPKESMFGLSEGLGIFFKQMSEGVFLSYSIYLHEKGQFWPGSELHPLGQSEKIILKENTEISGKFKIHYKDRIRKKDEDCERSETFMFTDCVSRYITTTVGCKADWISASADQNMKACSQSTEIQKYKEIMINLKEKTFGQLSKITKCFPKCSTTAYSFYLKEEKEENWTRNWTSAFFLHSSSSSPLRSSEYITFDSHQLMSDIGGYLGLFLGWSILHMGLEMPTGVLKFARHLYQWSLGTLAKEK